MLKKKKNAIERSERIAVVLGSGKDDDNDDADSEADRNNVRLYWLMIAAITTDCFFLLKRT